MNGHARKCEGWVAWSCPNLHSVQDVQGESDLVSLLHQLITLAYIDYIKYPFNHLILYKGDFVCHIKCNHMWSDASGNCRTIFLTDFEFLTFLTHISNFWIFFCHSQHVIASENAEFDFNNHKLMTVFHVRVHLDMGGQKGEQNSNMGQKCQKIKISQK